jgi:hypothetical protein
MKSLADVIAEPKLRPGVVADVVGLIDSEVAARGGLTGMAIKGGYAVVKKLQNGQMIPSVVDGLLPEFTRAIEPLHAEYRSAPGSGFGGFLVKNQTRAINALLAVTDARAKKTSHAILKSTYEKLRPMAEKQVAEALPGVGRVVDKHCA